MVGAPESDDRRTASAQRADRQRVTLTEHMTMDITSTTTVQAQPAAFYIAPQVRRRSSECPCCGVMHSPVTARWAIFTDPFHHLCAKCSERTHSAYLPLCETLGDVSLPVGCVRPVVGVN